MSPRATRSPSPPRPSSPLPCSSPSVATVQRAVDRRFDRTRYDAQLTADAFAERLRDEVDLDTLADELERTVSGAIRPTAASLWLPGRES